MTAASLAPRWNGRGSSGCSPTSRRVDVVVVHKIDRLSRSLADFAKLVDIFDRNGVAFVSVTQFFITTTSMAG
jgi:DNA invertase Pin-like site-specific DNA recombinase